MESHLTDNDPAAHAEIVALREAGRNVEITGSATAKLFATIERAPCARELRCMLASAVWYMAPTIQRRVQSIRF